jgi:hypothetical protein
MRIRYGSSLVMAAIFAFGCGDSTGVTLEDLVGTWQAQSYTFSDATTSVDLVATQGASFTLTVQEGGTVSTVFDNGIGGTSSNSGTFSADGSTLTLAGDTFTATRAGNSLTLVDATSEYDLDDDGSADPATLTIQLQR